ncbi:hypothetical protein ABT354_32540 [Streptomyces sp. NPDC000594]|uniref:hypothetical protein n=1 Tax=Streptomyces sp. NPDC000594 TaxID=3154261 RepID=UPI00331AAAD9
MPRADGLELETVEERPTEPAMWARLYRLWVDHESDPVLEVGDSQASSMISEARRTLPGLAERRAIVVTLRRPRSQGCEPYATE